MTKNLPIIVLLMCLIGSFGLTHAQTYPQLLNGGFELWDNPGAANQEPQNWNSFKTANCDLGILSGLACPTATEQRLSQSNHTRPGSTGSSSAKIWSTSALGIVANGNLTSGQIRIGSTTASDSTKNHNMTISTNASFRMPLTEVPDSIVFWAKFIPKNGSTTDQARMNAVIHDNSNYKDPTGALANRVAKATLNYNRTYDGTNYVWQRFSAPFYTAVGGSTNPAYILITFTTNKDAGGGSAGDTVYVDDVELIYNPKLNIGTINPLSYFVSASAGANVSVPFTISGPPAKVPVGTVITAQLSDASGSFANPVNIGTYNTTTAGSDAGTINAVIPAGTASGTNYKIRVWASSIGAIYSTFATDISITYIGNSVSPSAPQNLILSTNGTTLTVNESVTATSREWKFATTSGGPYSSFAPAETGTTYTPNFSTIGTYYVVCESQIMGQTYISNEVEVTVSNVNIVTGTIAGSPFEFSASAPNASVTVPFTVNGGTLNAANVFTAELSDANGSFAAPVAIGTANGSTSGTINASIPSNTPTGAGYRIRVVSSDFPLIGSDNGVDLVVDQFSNSIAPTTTQTIEYNMNGSAISVTESQSASRVWKFATVSGGPYFDFSPSETGASYTPNFPTVGTFYVVARSVNAHGDSITSNEVEIIVTNGTIIKTVSLSDSVFYLSPNANVQTTLDFTSNVLFNAGNTFTVEMSDETGDFLNSTVVGTLASDVVAPITLNIPNNHVNGGNYQFRVLSDDPVVTGVSGNVTGEVVQFEALITSTSPQFIFVGSTGFPVTAISTHPNSTYSWGTLSGSTFTPFSPAVTSATHSAGFDTPGVYNVACVVKNQWDDTDTTASYEVTVESVGLVEAEGQQILVINQLDYWAINFTESNFVQPTLQLIDMSGRTIYTTNNTTQGWNTIPAPAQAGVYVLRLIENGNVFHAKLVRSN